MRQHWPKVEGVFKKFGINENCVNVAAHTQTQNDSQGLHSFSTIACAGERNWEEVNTLVRAAATHKNSLQHVDVY